MSGLLPEPRDVDAPVLRLFRFRPRRPEFDTILRDVMLPDLATRPGLRWALVGRQGPDGSGERLVASLWTSHALMAEALGVDLEDPVFHPEYLPATEDRRLDFAAVAVALGDPTNATAGIARLVVGATRAGCRDQYLERAAQGAAKDAASGHGPRSVHIMVCGLEDFTTLSTWDDWSNVAMATGGSLADPDMTRHTDLLQHWHAEHFELASVQRPPGEPRTGGVLIVPRSADDPSEPRTKDVA